MEGQWQPNEATLGQILTVLRDSQCPDSLVQRSVQQRLEELNRFPDFTRYLLFVLTDLNIANEASRSLAGIVLKNHVRNWYLSYPDDLKQYVKQTSLKAIGDPSRLIRATIGMIITAIAQKGDLSTWPELLPTLCTLIDSQNINTAEVCTL